MWGTARLSFLGVWSTDKALAEGPVPNPTLLGGAALGAIGLRGLCLSTKLSMNNGFVGRWKEVETSVEAHLQELALCHAPLTVYFVPHPFFLLG